MGRLLRPVSAADCRLETPDISGNNLLTSGKDRLSPLVEAIGHDTFALAVKPGLKEHEEPLNDSPRCGRVAMAHPELVLDAGGHDDEGNVAKPGDANDPRLTCLTSCA